MVSVSALFALRSADLQALSERLNVHLESQGRRIACGSLPLGPVATASAGNATEIQAEVSGSSATG